MPEARANNSRGRSRQRGTVMIEFMIVAPILLLLLMAISEFGHALYQYNTLTKSVRDGARYLSKNATDSTDNIEIFATDVTQTINLVVYGNTGGGGSPKVPGLTTSHVTASCMGGGLTCPGVEHIEVTAQWPYQSIIGASLPRFGFGADLPLGFTLRTSATMRAM